MQLEVMRATDTTPQLRKQLKSLTLRAEGCMAGDFEYYRNYSSTKVIILSDDSGRVISWALMIKNRGSKGYALQLYTRKLERHKGYGRMIYRQAAKIARGRSNLTVFPDGYNYGFFERVHFGAVSSYKKKKVA